MNKVYSRINWENEPSTKTPLNEHNLNKIDFAVDEIDNRVIELDSTKAKNTDLQTLSTRVDNLILNAGDSSAECTDARVTEDGTTYDTLKKRLDAEHSSVIEDISQLSDEIGVINGIDIWTTQDSNFSNDYEFERETPIFHENQWITPQGEIQTNQSGNYLGEIEVKGGEQFIVTNRMGYVPAHYVVIDTRGDVLQFHHSPTYTLLRNHLVTIPFGASKMYFTVDNEGRENEDLFCVKKITKKIIKLPECIQKIENLFNLESTENVNGKYYSCSSFEENINDVLGTTHFIEVFKGDKIVFKRSASWIIGRFNFSLWNKKERNASSLIPISDYTLENEVITIIIPENCYFTATYKQSEIENFVILRNVNEYPSEVLPYGYYYYLGSNLKVPNVNNDILYGKSALFVGDSICEGVNGGTVKGWCYAINENNPSMTCLNYSKGGACVGYYDGQTVTNVLTQLDKAYSEHNSFDFVIIEGGVNDAWSSGKIQVGELSSDYETFNDNVFAQALEHVFYKAMTYYPNAKIGYIIPQIRTDNSEIYMEKAIEVCKKWSVPYIDFRFNFGFSYNIPSIQEKYFKGAVTNDTTHPNAIAYREIFAPKIEAWMKSM